MIGRRLFLVLVLLCVAHADLYAAKKKEKKEPEPPPVYYVVEVFDLFEERGVSVCTTKELRALEDDLSKKNNSVKGAFKTTAEAWTESEKERVEALKKQKEGAKAARMNPRRQFILKHPGLARMNVDGPYEELEVATQKATERQEKMQKDLDFAASSAEQKAKLMSERLLADHEAKLELEQVQKELFLAKLESLGGKSSLTAGGGGMKRVGGSIKPMVNNTHRMMNPGANAGTATKVDPRAVK